MTSRTIIATGGRGRSVLAALITLLLLGGCNSQAEHGHSHEAEGHGHEHGEHGHGEEAEPATEAVTLAADKLELFMEHPYLVKGEGAKFNVHLTVLADGMPIRGGKLTATAKGPTGKTVTVVQEKPRSPGIYGPAIAFPEAGKNELSLALESEQATETIRLAVTVYEDAHEAEHAAEHASEEEPEGAITFLKEQAWEIGLIIQPVEKRRLVQRLVVPGEIGAAAGAKVVVTPPLSGRMLPPVGGTFPRVGEQVKEGQVLAVVQGLQADLGEKLREAEIEIRQAKIELDHARTIYERQKALRASEAISQRQFDESEHNFRTAETAYQGRLEAKKIYEESRLNPQAPPPASPGEATKKKDAPLPSSFLLLRSPMDGTVTTAAVTEGEYVDPAHELFTVIDLSRVWVEARVSEYDLERVETAPGASLRLAAYPNRRFDILGESRGRLIDVGSVVDVPTRTLPVRYELQNPERVFRIGMFAEVAIETKQAQEAAAIPESAIVDEDGRPTAYVLLDGEHFQKRDLELGVHDSGFVEVIRGLDAGERVVTKGAYAIRLASVSSVIPAHGHAH